MNSVANWISDKTIDLDAVNHKIAEAMRTNVMTNSGP